VLKFLKLLEVTHLSMNYSILTPTLILVMLARNWTALLEAQPGSNTKKTSTVLMLVSMKLSLT
jgi:hypothetical protein